MNTARRNSDTGLIAGICALVLLVCVALLIQQFFVSPIVERERAALVKSLHVQQMLSITGAQDEKTRSELAAHLAALRDGGEFSALNRTSYWVPESNSSDLIAAANAIEKVLSQGGQSSLLRLTDNLVSTQQFAWNKLIKKIQWYRYLAGLSAFLLLVFIFVQFFRCLNRTKSGWNATITKNKHILGATKEALISIKPSLKVGSVQSLAVQAVFGVREPIEGDFIAFLKRFVSPQDLVAVKEHTSFMLGQHAHQSPVVDLDTLNEVEAKIETSPGVFTKKYLSFDFARNEHSPAAGLLVSVSDISKEVRLRQKLAAVSRENEERFALLMSSIATESGGADVFYRSVHDSIRDINELLRDDDQEHDTNAQKLQDILRTVHQLKIDAGVAGVALLETSADQFVAKVQGLLDQEKVSDHHIIGLTKQLTHLISELGLLEQLNAKMKAKESTKSLRLANAPANMPVSGGVSNVSREPASPRPETVEDYAKPDTLSESDRLKAELTRFGEQEVKRQSKNVHIETVGFEDFTINESAAVEISRLCTQLIRNSLTHGIELSSIRREASKPIKGRIVISLKKRDDNSVILRVWDDGKGFDFAAIRVAAVARGLVADDTVNGMKKSDLVRFIFVSGFSTRGDGAADQLREETQIGVGLDIVKNSVVKLGGKITVKSARGVYSQVAIQLPMSALTRSESPPCSGPVFAKQASEC